MVKNLTEKILRDAGEKAEKQVNEARAELEKMFEDRKKVILEKYKDKLERAKKSIDSERERETANFRMERAKEVLHYRNRLINEAMEALQEKFNEFLKEDFKEIVTSVVSRIGGKNYTVKIPESAESFDIEGAVVEKTSEIENSFVVEGEDWTLMFDWERFSSAAAGEIKQIIGGHLFGDAKGGKDKGN